MLQQQLGHPRVSPRLRVLLVAERGQLHEEVDFRLYGGGFDPGLFLERTAYAFDVAIEVVLKRIKKQKERLEVDGDINGSKR